MAVDFTGCFLSISLCWMPAILVKKSVDHRYLVGDGRQLLSLGHRSVLLERSSQVQQDTWQMLQKGTAPMKWQKEQWREKPQRLHAPWGREAAKLIYRLTKLLSSKGFIGRESVGWKKVLSFSGSLTVDSLFSDDLLWHMLWWNLDFWV